MNYRYFVLNLYLSDFVIGTIITCIFLCRCYICPCMYLYASGYMCVLGVEIGGQHQDWYSEVLFSYPPMRLNYLKSKTQGSPFTYLQRTGIAGVHQHTERFLCRKLHKNWAFTLAFELATLNFFCYLCTVSAHT